MTLPILLEPYSAVQSGIDVYPKQQSEDLALVHPNKRYFLRRPMQFMMKHAQPMNERYRRVQSLLVDQRERTSLAGHEPI